MKKLMLLLFLLLVGCGPTPDLSILDKSSCKLPCWNGIIAGQTTEGELLEILESSPEVDQATVRNTHQAWNIFDNQIYFSLRQGWIWGQQSKREGEIDIMNGKASLIMLCGEINTTLGVLVEAIGEPESIISGNNYYGDRTVILTYPRNGVSSNYTTTLEKPEISPDTQLDCITLFDPSQYTELLEIGVFSAGYYNAEETLKVMYTWDGYGNLDEKYPPRRP